MSVHEEWCRREQAVDVSRTTKRFVVGCRSILGGHDKHEVYLGEPTERYVTSANIACSGYGSTSNGTRPATRLQWVASTKNMSYWELFEKIFQTKTISLYQYSS